MIAILFYFLSMGIAWNFALFILFGGSLKQRHFAHFGKRQKLVNYRGLKWVLVCLILNWNKHCDKVWPYLLWYEIKNWAIQAGADKKKNSRTSVAKICIIWIIEKKTVMEGRLEIHIWQIVYRIYFRMVFLLDDAFADIFIYLSEELRTNLEIVGETRMQWVIIFCQMSILCSTNGLSLLFAVFLGENTIVLENPNGFL